MIEMFNIIEMYPLIGYIFVFVLSAIVGSFLNVVIYRYPIMIQYDYAEIIRDNSNDLSKDVLEVLERGKGMSLSLPRSHCFECKKQISWFNNIPLFSYLILKGKCSNCKVSYSSRYFFIELIHVLGWLGLFAILGVSINFVVFAIVFSLILTMSMIDVDHKILPDGLVFSLYGLGLLFSISEKSLISPEDAIFNSIVGFIVCHTFTSLYSKIRGQLMVGFGDIKLVTAMLAFIPVMNVVMSVLIACLLGIVFFIVMKIAKKMEKTDYMAFGQFICLGFFIQIIFLILKSS